MTAQLRVQVISVRDLPKKSGLLDKTDAYVVCQIGNAVQQTDVAKNCGSTAMFHHIMTLPHYGESVLAVSVKDHDKLGKGELIGTGTLQLSDLVLTQGFKGYVPIMSKKDTNTGEVYIILDRIC
eukprot:Gregarina_sp_Poly_1__7853@NODE_445_length_8333_cov_573_313090_g363_i0_p5_GENE_NODE_445_length_8333_cov_573_313090_g363_i0NODE_445_length_8333_cov_573_313090_g363_i0_p5_ORF_typecomplete_len124_score11_85C2/PF00168_30/2_4e15_NODE_445_length_8333_cov_573_313090_g363_i053625733